LIDVKSFLHTSSVKINGQGIWGGGGGGGEESHETIGKGSVNIKIPSNEMKNIARRPSIILTKNVIFNVQLDYISHLIRTH
jgi:hypothetical protein